MAAEDLEARVARLEQAVAAASTALGGAGPGRPATPAIGGTPTTPVAKGVRTVVQLAVAAVPSAGLAALLQRPEVAWVLTLVLAPVVTWLQNALEDAHKLRALLRDVGDPPDTPPAGRDLAP